MLSNTELLVLPRKKVLTGHGDVWEYCLAEHGWNELTCPDKYGVVVGIFELPKYKVVVMDVHWPALNMTLKSIFPDELSIEEI